MHSSKIQSLILALPFLSLIFPPSASADRFSTTECHCMGLSEKIEGNGILTMSYFHDASKATGYTHMPCGEKGCDPRRDGYMFCGMTVAAPGSRAPAFRNDVGLCYVNSPNNKKKLKDRILFPLGNLPAQGSLEALGGDDNEDMDAEWDEEDEIDIDTDVSEDVDDDDDDIESMDTLPPNITPQASNATWQILKHKQTRRLNSKSVCKDLCPIYYPFSLPDCGTYVLPDRRNVWKNKCKRTTWWTLPRVPAFTVRVDASANGEAGEADGVDSDTAMPSGGED